MLNKKKSKQKNAVFQWLVDHVRPSVGLNDSSNIEKVKDSVLSQNFYKLKDKINYKISFKWKF